MIEQTKYFQIGAATLLLGAVASGNANLVAVASAVVVASLAAPLYPDSIFADFLHCKKTDWQDETFYEQWSEDEHSDQSFDEEIESSDEPFEETDLDAEQSAEVSAEDFSDAQPEISDQVSGEVVDGEAGEHKDVN